MAEVANRTPEIDALRPLIDQGWKVVLFANDLGSITAMAKKIGKKTVYTDHFTVSETIVALRDKMLGTGWRRCPAQGPQPG